MQNRTPFMGVKLALACVAAVSVSACSTKLNQEWGLPGEQHKITVEQVPERLALTLSPGNRALSQRQKTTLRGYAAAYLDHGYGPLVISIPEGSDTASAGRHAAGQTQKILVESGIDWAVLVKGNYQASGTSGAPLLLSFTRYVAQAQGCEQRWKNLARAPGNNESDNFGCALAINTAAMIANPYELVRPSPTEPASTARRQTVMDKYIAGEISSAARSSDSKGTVSDAVN